MTMSQRENDEPGTVDLTLSYSTSYTGDGEPVTGVNLRAEDRVSGSLLFDLKLTGDQFTALLSSKNITVTGARVAPMPHTIGKRAQHASLAFKRGDYPDPLNSAEEWVATMKAQGWEAGRAWKTNVGAAGHVTRWD